ncbi:MAG: hypothetical protein U5Q03_18205 [Bacteroidota bacterium]|nr:hypothetical protein [Bacteroidota bacterium]
MHFAYDKLNRVLGANYGEDISGSWVDKSDFDVYGISYDYNGNIQSLKRNGLRTYPGDGPAQFGAMDDLDYSYDSGNKLQSVNDNVPDFTFNSNDFRDNGAEGSEEYSYDANANVKSDANKGITNITYNFLNLPELINFADGTVISYLYTTNGSKLKSDLQRKHKHNNRLCSRFCLHRQTLWW